MRKSLVGTVMVAALLWGGCGSSKDTANLPVEERFQHAKALFDNGDYLEAINEFQVITLQYAGSASAADAQFYLAECRFKRGEYLLAAFEYGVLKRNMPASPKVPEAQYKTGVSYFNMAPKSSLDQQYTRKAIDELQAFIEYYPGNEFAPDADAKIKDLTGRLAKKQYETAQLYARLESYKASIFYYDDVIEKYHDTEYAPLAYLGKTEVLIAKKKYQDALTEINKFIAKFPNSVLRGRADRLKEVIEKELKSGPAASGKDSGSVFGVQQEAVAASPTGGVK